MRWFDFHPNDCKRHFILYANWLLLDYTDRDEVKLYLSKPLIEQDLEPLYDLMKSLS